jgi:DNA-binding transcriptional LysR family regulator
VDPTAPDVIALVGPGVTPYNLRLPLSEWNSHSSKFIIPNSGTIMDRLQTMSVFVAVAEEAGFAPAARRLNMSPPSVTRAVSELETRLGSRLLHRTTRTVQMTEAGRRYLADCRRILQEIEDADGAAAGIHSQLRGTISVTAPVMFGRMHVAEHLFSFLDLHPDVSITTFFVDRVVDIVDEGLDVAVRIAELPDSSLSATRVGSIRRVLCASPDYLAERGMPASPADLAGHDTIAFSAAGPGVEWTFQQAGKRMSHKPRSRFHANKADVAISAALDGHGITRVLSYMIAPHLERGSLRLVLDDVGPPPVPVHVVHKETGHTSARVRAVFDFLADRLREDFQKIR